MTDVILSYGDCLLRSADIKLLRGPHWINDTLISFYMEYLWNEVFKRDPALVFVSSEVTQCIKVSPLDQTGVFLDPLLKNLGQFLFFPLNNNDKADACGGTHWSLLIISLSECIALHFDSSATSNLKVSLNFASKILRYLKLPKVKIDRFLKQVKCPQQINGYDCGVHVMCNVECIAHYVQKFQKLEGCIAADISEVCIKRSLIIKIIRELKKR